MFRINKLHLVFLFLIPLFLVIVWFKSSFILAGGDGSYEFINPPKAFILSKLVWWDVVGGVPNTDWLSRETSIFLSALLSDKLYIPNYIIQAGIFYIVQSVGIISIYYLILFFLNEYIYKEKVAFVASIFYLLNPFSMSQIWGRELDAAFFEFALLPISVLFYMKGLTKKKYIYVFYTILLSIVFSTSFGLLSFTITYWTTLTCCFLYWLFINRQGHKKILFGIIYYISSIIIWFTSHSWWLLTSVISANNTRITAGDTDFNLGSLLGVSKNFPPLILIRLMQKTFFYDNHNFSPFYLTFIFQLISFLIPLFLIVGLIAILKNKILIDFRFFIFLFILGFIVSSGPNPPFGWLFVWVFKTFPFLQIFRNPYEKFGIVYVLGYVPIFALGVVHFFEKIKKFKLLGLGILLFLVCGIFAFPMWTGKVLADFGVDVPNYYSHLNNWLTEIGDQHRLFMTPIWKDGVANYKWKNSIYQGSDPMIFLLDYPAISFIPDYPPMSDFMKYLRRYEEQVNTAPILELFRAKYVIDRGDAIVKTDYKKQSINFLIGSIIPPLGSDLVSDKICNNLFTNSSFDEVPKIICQIPLDKNNWRNVKYLHLKLKTDEPSLLDILVLDKNGVSVRWLNKGDDEYTTDSSEWKMITLNLNTPVEWNDAMDYSNIAYLLVLARPKDKTRINIKQISLETVGLDPGRVEKLNNFKFVQEFGPLKVYEPLYFNAPEEFGNLLSIIPVSNFLQLFKEADKNKKNLDKLGIILLSQNSQRKLDSLPLESNVLINKKFKISDTRYWVEVDNSFGKGLLTLNKNFHSSWKVIPGLEREKLNGGFFNDINILKKVVLPEEDHFVINGYANLWLIGSKDKQFGIVFMPQIIAEIGRKISIWSIILLLGVTIIWRINKVFLRQ